MVLNLQEPTKALQILHLLAIIEKQQVLKQVVSLAALWCSITGGQFFFALLIGSNARFGGSNVSV